jgi:WD40 repeat protein
MCFELVSRWKVHCSCGPDFPKQSGHNIVHLHRKRRKAGFQNRPASFVRCIPAFSPDGKYLAFISGPGFLANDVYVVPTTGGKPRALTSVHSTIWGVSWTPDSQQLVFDSNHQGMPTLWRVRLSGGDPEPLTVAADYALVPTISLRGNRLVYLRSAVDTNLWKAPLSPVDHGKPARIVASTRQEMILPSLPTDSASLLPQIARAVLKYMYALPTAPTRFN